MRFVALLVFLLPATAFAQTLDFNVRDSALWARYSTLVDEYDFGQIEVDGTAFVADNSRRAVGFGLHVVDNAYTAETPVYVGLGARAIWVDSGPRNGTVIAVGAHGRITLPEADRVSLGAHLYFSPDILAFGRATGYSEVAVRGEYQMLQSSWVYLGYRRARANYSGVSARTFDSGVHLGMRIQF